MLGKTYDAEVCSIARALEVVGERWSLLILRNAMFAGHTRFTQFQRSLGIATNVLGARLDGLVAAGILRRQPADGHEYVLTDKGWDLQTALVALTEWGDRWAAPAGPPVRYQHQACGGTVTTSLACTECGTVDPPSVQALPGPGMPADRAERMLARVSAPVASRRHAD